MPARLNLCLVAMVAGLLLGATPASALSKHVFSTSFGSSGPVPLTNPTDVAVDESTGDVWVANASVNEVQRVVVKNATGGTFTLTFAGQSTAPLSYKATTAQIASALAALSTIGQDSLSVTQGALTFTGDLAETDVEQITADSSGLIGTGHTVSIETLIGGAHGSQVEKFTSAGQLILVIGKEVDATTHADLCTVSSGDTCQPGARGSLPGAFNGEFESPFVLNSSRLFLALDNSPGGGGSLYVGDPGNRVVQKFDSAGNLITDWGDGGVLDGSTAVGGKRPMGLLRTGSSGSRSILPVTSSSAAKQKTRLRCSGLPKTVRLSPTKSKM